jgi:hypothetical protein
MGRRKSQEKREKTIKKLVIERTITFLEVLAFAVVFSEVFPPLSQVFALIKIRVIPF